MRFAIVLAVACSSAPPRPVPVENSSPPRLHAPASPELPYQREVLAAAGITDENHVANAIVLSKLASRSCNDDEADTDRVTLRCDYGGAGGDAATCRGAAALVVAEHSHEFPQPMDATFRCDPVAQHAVFDRASNTVTVDGDDGVHAAFALPSE